MTNTQTGSGPADWISAEIEEDRRHREIVQSVVDMLVSLVAQQEDHELEMAKVFAQLRDIDEVDAELLRQALNEALQAGSLVLTPERHLKTVAA